MDKILFTILWFISMTQIFLIGLVTEAKSPIFEKETIQSLAVIFSHLSLILLTFFG